MRISDEKEFSITYTRTVEYFWEGSFEDLPEAIRAAVEAYKPEDKYDAHSDHLYAVLSNDTALLSGLDANAATDETDTTLDDVS